jgi:adenylate kinase
MKVFIFIGGPGSGKGTQASIIENKLGYKKISTGDILRVTASADNDLGKKLKLIMSEGKFVPEDIMMSIIEEEIKSCLNSCKGVVFDGFPRTIFQAENLDIILAKYNLEISKVLYFSISSEKLLERVSGRFSCADCLASYHKIFKPTAKNNVCDSCGGSHFVTREDDNSEVMIERLDKFSEMTRPLLPYYESRHLLINIDADRQIEEVSKDIISCVFNE